MCNTELFTTIKPLSPYDVKFVHADDPHYTPGYRNYTNGRNYGFVDGWTACYWAIWRFITERCTAGGHFDDQLHAELEAYARGFAAGRERCPGHD